MFGAHLIPNHFGQDDEKQIKRIQPKSIKIINPDPGRLRRLYDLSPKSLFVLRDHPLSEQKDDVAREPTATGWRHAREWIIKLEQWNLPIPREQVVVLGINEPPVWLPGYIQSISAYTVAFLEELAEQGIRGGALNLAVGWPANTGPDTPPDWSPYVGVERAIQDGGHFLFLHEYWDDRGPLRNWGWWAGRYEKCPWDVPIIIGECGVDQYVADGSVAIDSRGWQGRLTPAEYSAQLAKYEMRLRQDKRIHSYQPFTWDFGHPWKSFDIRPILSFIKTDKEFDHSYTAGLPVKPDDNDDFQRAIDFVLRWEGGYVNHPDDPGGETKYGITKRSYPHLDIKNLTKAEAIEIYRQDYWIASSADKMKWPLALVHFDAAVNHGVARAMIFLAESSSPLSYLAKRQRYYTGLRHFDTFGRGWMRRMADLVEEVGK